MPQITQVNQLVNSMASQQFGRAVLGTNNYIDVIDLGALVLSSDTNKEGFLNILADRISQTNLRTLDLEVEFPKLLRTPTEWGFVIQKINIQPFEAKSQEAWNVGANGFRPTNFDVDKPVITQTFFKGPIDAWEYDVTIPDQMLKTAFTSSNAFGAFIDGIMSALSDSMVIALDNMAYGCISNFVAEKIKANNGIIHILTDFNTQAGTSYASLDKAINDKEFYRYTGMIMRNVIKYMERPSVLYNTGGMVRATQRDNLNCLISSDFWSGYSTYLSSDTFHNELIKLDGFKEFTTLQGTGTTTPNITANTTIKCIPASEKDEETPTTITQSGIIGIFTDREAMGVAYEDRFITTDRNNRNRYTNYTSGASLHYFNDLSENGIIIIAD